MFRIALIAFSTLFLGSDLLAQRPGSIYDPTKGPMAMIDDKVARRPGDLVTVLIAESQDVRNEETSNLQKSTNLDYELQVFDIKPNLFDPLPAIQAASTDDFEGKANYEKRGTFSARITAIVVDTLPNGNLILNGRREIRVDRETKVIEFSGVIRQLDIKNDNTIRSELVAEARIAYAGEGPMTRSTNRSGIGGLIHRFIAWIWPF